MQDETILVVGNSPAQNSYIYNFLNQSNYQIESITGGLRSPYKKKNIANLSFLSKIKRQLFFGIQSIDSFSFYHAAFFQKKSDYFLINYLFKAMSYFSRKNPKLSSSLLKSLDDLSVKFSKKVDKKVKAIFFTGIMTTRKELELYFSAVKSDIPTIYCPYNWDNPSSKLYVPTFGFTYSFSWGNQMQELFNKRKKDFGKSTVNFPYRLDYLRGIKDERDLNNKRRNILIALSQKGTSSVASLLKEVANAVQRIPEIEKIIIRPHPQNSLYKEFLDLCTSISPNIEIDQSFINVYMKKGEGIIPMTDREFRKEKDLYLHNSLTETSLVICEGGTLCLESGYLKIPVIGLLNNSMQVTAKVFGHFDHFVDLSSFLWFKPIFTTKNLEKLIPDFLKSFELESVNNFENVYDVLSKKQLNLEECLNFIGIEQ